MINRPLGLLLIALMLSLTASAQTNSSIYSQEIGVVRVVVISMEIDPSGTVSVSEELIVRGGDIVSIIIPSGIQNLAVSDSQGSLLSIDLVPRDGKQLLSFVPKKSGGEELTTISVKYSSQGLTGKLGDVWDFNYSAGVTPLGEAPSGTIIKLYTPQKMQITNIDYKDFYWSPVGDSEIWIYPLTKEFNLNFKYRLDASGPLIPRSTTTTLTTQGNGSAIPGELVMRDYLIAFIIFFAFLLLVVWTITYMKKSKDAGSKTAEKAEEEPPSGEHITTINQSHQAKDLALENDDTGHEAHDALESTVEYPSKASVKVRKVKDSVRNVLDETEKRIVELMEGFEEEITQAYIYKSTGIPKSSLSDTIRRLEKRNVLERKKDGRTNWLKLKEDIFD